MNTFRADQLRSATRGRWHVAPEDSFSVSGVGTDTREPLHDRAFIALRGPRHDAHDHLWAAVEAGAAMLIVDRAPPSSLVGAPRVPVLQVADARAALLDLAAAHRKTLKNTTVIAVTGSCGKTTTKELIHFALASERRGTRAPKSFNNDVGVPLTLLAASPDDDYLIVEIGMNQPGEIGTLARIVKPDVGVITTVGPAHLAGLGSVEAIAEEKRTLLDHLTPQGFSVLNADHDFALSHARRHPEAILFGQAPMAHLRLTAHGRDDAQDVWWFDVNDRVRYRLALPGRHNAVNALAAVAIAQRMGLNEASIARGLSGAALPAMRLTRHDVDGIILYNDAHNANPQSMHASIRAFLDAAAPASRRVLILGDMLELGPASASMHRVFARELLVHDDAPAMDHFVLIGELMRHAAEVLSEHWGPDRVEWAPALDQRAIDHVWGMLDEDDAVLLKGSRGMGLERILTNRPIASRSAAVGAGA